MTKNKQKFGIPQEILYTVCLAAWKLCSQNLEKFTLLKSFYTEAFVASAKQAIQDAKNLPDIIQTMGARKDARIDLMVSTKQVLANWQVLKVYITKAYDQGKVKAKLDAAGAALYKKAVADNWSAVRSLVEAANTFISNNLEALTANGNMPAVFQTSFKEDGDNCIALSVIYSNVSMEKQAAIGTKVDANNAIHASVTEMLKDGQQIFKNDPLMKRQFTYSYLVKMNKGERPASLRGIVLNNLKLPVKDAVIESLDLRFRATTNAKGHYQVKRIATGTYTFRIMAPGYEPQEKSIVFVAGVASKGDFTLQAQMLKVA